jgi:hypothetical protein
MKRAPGLASFGTGNPSLPAIERIEIEAVTDMLDVAIIDELDQSAFVRGLRGYVAAVA